MLEFRLITIDEMANRRHEIMDEWYVTDCRLNGPFKLSCEDFKNFYLSIRSLLKNNLTKLECYVRLYDVHAAPQPDEVSLSLEKGYFMDKKSINLSPEVKVHTKSVLHLLTNPDSTGYPEFWLRKIYDIIREKYLERYIEIVYSAEDDSDIIGEVRANENQEYLFEQFTSMIESVTGVQNLLIMVYHECVMDYIVSNDNILPGDFVLLNNPSGLCIVESDHSHGKKILPAKNLNLETASLILEIYTKLSVEDRNSYFTTADDVLASLIPSFEFSYISELINRLLYTNRNHIKKTFSKDLIEVLPDSELPEI